MSEYEKKIIIFFEEHIHDDEEIRYILDGSGVFEQPIVCWTSFCAQFGVPRLMSSTQPSCRIPSVGLQSDSCSSLSWNLGQGRRDCSGKHIYE